MTEFNFIKSKSMITRCRMVPFLMTNKGEFKYEMFEM